jgi:hypothetical protein
MNTLHVKGWEWLQKTLIRNQHTLYGKQYHFDCITTIEQYQNNVPLVSYEDIKPFIHRISMAESDVLFTGKALAFEMTGGSSGGAKLIPYTSESFVDFQQAILPWFHHTLSHYAIHPQNTYWAISPVNRTVQQTQGNIPIGVSDEHYLGIQSSHALVPSWVAEVKSMKEWKIASLYWLIVAESLELISIWSPTFLLVLLEGITLYAEELAHLFLDGGTLAKHALSANHLAYKRLQTYLKMQDTHDLWPNLKLISLWMDGSSKLYAHQLQAMFPSVTFQPKGLISTEAVVTTLDEDETPLLSENGFYEFIDAQNQIMLAEHLTIDHCYEVVITTSGGLYRYKTFDVVQCMGYKNQRPILRFIGRKNRTSDLVGEKLTEAFVAGILHEVSGFAMLVPQHEHTPPYYQLVVDKKNKTYSARLLESIEEKLHVNPQYAYARTLNQLAPLKIVPIENPISLYSDYVITQGQSIGDIKIPALTSNTLWLPKEDQ